MAEKSKKERSEAQKTAWETRRARKAELEEKAAHKKQIAAVILFAIGILSAAIAFIAHGKPFWEWLHTAHFGLFGWCGYIVPVMFIYSAVVLSLKKFSKNSGKKILEVTGLLLMLCAVTEVFSKQTDYTGFAETVKGFYEKGAAIKGGGVFALPIAGPLLAFLGKVPAIVITLLLLFVIIMLITRTTVSDLFEKASKPVKKIEQSYTEHVQKKRRIDIPVDDKPATKAAAAAVEDTRSAREKLIQAANNNNAPEVPAPAPAAEEEVLPENEVQMGLNDLIRKAKRPEERKEVFEPVATGAGQDGQEYLFPPIDLLERASEASEEEVGEELKNNAEKLVDTLKSFGAETKITAISRGPTVTRYELMPLGGVKVKKITALADDIALSLAASGVRIEAPIPNKAAVGVEVPNKVRSTVSLREIVASDKFAKEKSKTTVAVGLNIDGEIITADIAKMPHALIAGTTGSGKSVCMNSFIVSLLYKASPDEVKFIMIDPKRVEFIKYEGLPHLLAPVVTDPRKASGALGWAVNEMLKRYKLFGDNGVNDIKSYNKKAEETGEFEKIPQIVIFIDELSDLMMAAPKDVEDHIFRLAQMARAAGMYLVIATQRPSVNVITGVIKANIPTRIALMLSSQIDSRTILDCAGAEKLLGNGDMLIHLGGSLDTMRVQGCFVSDDEVRRVVEFIRESKNAQYDDDVVDEIERQSADGNKNGAEDGDADDADPMLPAAIECVIDMGQASVSMLQRKLKLGYSRAGRLMDEMESRGIIGPFEGSKPRQVLITRQQWIEMKMNTDENQL